MTEETAQSIALRHYRTKWFDQAWEEVAGEWQVEYDSVSAGTFAALQILSQGGDGWNSSGQKNFEQGARLDALQKFRAENDAEYAAAVFAPAPASAAGPSVMYPIFGAGCFPH